MMVSQVFKRNIYGIVLGRLGACITLADAYVLY